MNPIEEAIDAISSAVWAELLADCVGAIIFIAGLFMLMKLGKRLLRMAADAHDGEYDSDNELWQGADHPDDFIDHDGQVWENGEPTGEYLSGDHDAHVAEYDKDIWEGAESVDAPELECPDCGHQNTYDDINSDERCTECGHPLEL